VGRTTTVIGKRGKKKKRRKKSPPQKATGVVAQRAEISPGMKNVASDFKD